MQTQPSAQGIASLYMGNPDALQQRVQKEQQAKPGLPPDLKKLMALNIVTNEEDAAKRQQAMNALNSMAPAGEEPPTVAQSVQKQAKQAMQAKMLQQQRQQQGLQALAQRSPSMEVPEGVPQPEAQPQGIDDLPVEMEFAGGGIVAFSKGDTTKAEPTQEELEQQRREDAEKLRAIKNFLGEALGDAAIKSTAAGADILSLIPRGLAGAVDTALIRPARAMGADVGYLSPSLTPGPQSSDTMTPFYDRYIRAREEKKEAPTQADETRRNPNATREYMDRAGPMTAPKFMDPRIVRNDQERPIADLKAAAEQRASRPPSGPRPAPAPAPTAAAPTAAAPTAQAAPATGLDALYEQNIRKRMEMDPEKRAKAFGERYKKEVGAPDTSQYDRLIAELEGRKKQFDAPKAGFDAFAEYMGQIAAQGPQRDWATAGARGAAAQTALNKERQAQQFDLTKQGIDIAQKKLDAERGFKKDLFTLTEKERDDIEKQVQDATKEYGLSKRDADKFKRDLEMEALRHKNSLALEGVRSRNQLAAKGRDYTAELIDAMQRKDTEAVKRITEALEINKGSGKVNPVLRDPIYAELSKKYADLVASITTLPEGNKLRIQRENEARALKLQLDLMAGRTANAPVESTGAPPPGAVREVKR